MGEFLLALARGFWSTFTQMSPYLLFGFLVAGLLSILVPPSLVERHLGGRGIWPVVKSSLFGVPLPLCSCGVIPVAASLRRHGASKGATTAFLLSTPQTGVDSILVTYSLMGMVIAVFRPIAAFVSGLIGGAAVILFDAEELDDYPMQCEGACCVENPKRGRIASVLHYGFVTLPRDIAKALVAGVAVAAVIAAVVPNDFLAGRLGTGVVGMLVMMAVGIPMYVCATASVPIAAALIAKGASPGAALVFLMTGPATNAATIMTVWKIMGKRTAIVYLATVALTSLAGGMILDEFFPGAILSGGPAHSHEMGARVFDTVAAFALLAVLGAAMWPAKRKAEPEDKEGRMKATFLVGGMKCSHCTDAVERALGECAGVEKATVDLKTGTATVVGSGFDEKALRAKVEGLGYTVKECGKQGNK